MEHEPAVTLENVSVTRGGVSILEGVDATIHRGEVTAVIGPNGAGKTTLFLAILGLVRHTGAIRFSFGVARPTIGYVPQKVNLERGTPITPMDFLVLSIQSWPLWLGWRKAPRSRAAMALDRVGAGHLALRPLGELSGGEQQRVLLAMAVLREPQLLLLDEPSAGVDIAGEQVFCDMLESLQKERKFTLVMVSHDLSVVTRHADHVICLNKTVRCQGTAPQVLTPENIEAIYGVHMGLYAHGGKLPPCREQEGHTHV